MLSSKNHHFTQALTLLHYLIDLFWLKSREKKNMQKFALLASMHTVAKNNCGSSDFSQLRLKRALIKWQREQYLYYQLTDS